MNIEQFQQLNIINEFDLNEMDKATQMVMVLTGKTEDEVDKMSIKKFSRLCERINKSFDFLGKKIPKYFVLGFRLYKIELNIKKMKAGKYVEGIEFGKNHIENLHKMMASAVIPCNWLGMEKPIDGTEHEDLAEKMLKCNFKVAFSCCVFFCKLFTASMKSSHHYLKMTLMSKGMSKEQAEEQLKGLQQVLDGIAAANRWQNMKELN
jgi:hypothetical protein